MVQSLKLAVENIRKNEKEERQAYDAALQKAVEKYYRDWAQRRYDYVI